MASPQQRRVYRGRSRVCCGGRCVAAQNLAIFYLTLCLILVCSALFFAFDCRFLAVSLSPAVPAAGALLLALVLCCLLRTTCSDPGIIPRGSGDEAAWIEDELEPPMAEPHGAYRPQARLKEVVIGGRQFRLKYCFTCKLWRPPRASHCSSCDNCVDRFDHHCPWVGNCVGRRNYRYFFMFLASLSVYCLYILIFSIVNVVMLAKDKNNLLDALKESPPSVLVILVAFFSIWSVMGLAGFHVLLICREESTNEDIKGVFNKKRNPDSVNPFDRGDGCSNCCYVLFGPNQPSLLTWGSGHFGDTANEADIDPDADARDSSSVEGLLSNGGGRREPVDPAASKNGGGGSSSLVQQYGSTGSAAATRADVVSVGLALHSAKEASVV